MGANPEILLDYPFISDPSNMDEFEKNLKILIETNFRKIGRKLRKIAQKRYSWLNVADKTLKAYESIM